MGSSLDTVRPLDLARLESALSLLELQYLRDDEGLILAFPSGVISASLVGAGPGSAEVLEILGRWRGQGLQSQAEQLLQVALDANRELVWPKVNLLVQQADQAGSVGLATSVASYCPRGMNDAQLRAFLSNAISATLRFFKVAALELPELCTWPEESAHA